jgi:hypothetical protein
MVKIRDGAGQVHEVPVARLVLAAAFGPLVRGRGFRVRHEDGDPSNCALANLAYGPSRRSFLTLAGRNLGDGDLLARGFTWRQVPAW